MSKSQEEILKEIANGFSSGKTIGENLFQLLPQFLEWGRTLPNILNAGHTVNRYFFALQKDNPRVLVFTAYNNEGNTNVQELSTVGMMLCQITGNLPKIGVNNQGSFDIDVRHVDEVEDSFRMHMVMEATQANTIGSSGIIKAGFQPWHEAASALSIASRRERFQLIYCPECGSEQQQMRGVGEFDYDIRCRKCKHVHQSSILMHLLTYALKKHGTDLRIHLNPCWEERPELFMGFEDYVQFNISIDPSKISLYDGLAEYQYLI